MATSSLNRCDLRLLLRLFEKTSELFLNNSLLNALIKKRLIDYNSLTNVVVSRKKERTTIMLTSCGNPIEKTIDFVGLQFNTSVTGDKSLFIA